MNVIREKLQEWLGVERGCSCGQTHVVRTRFLFEGRLTDGLREMIETCGFRSPVVVGMDANLASGDGRTVAPLLETLDAKPIVHVFRSTDGIVIPNEETLKPFGRAIREANAQWVLGVGSGTVNDLCKYAASQAGLPYVVCPTAASMNGYTSTIAALKQQGLKVTVSCAPAVGLVVDPTIARRAPRILAAAGFADLMSKYVCNADWLLSYLVEGGYYCDVPFQLASAATDAIAPHARAVAAGESDAIALLEQALLLSGVAMAAAGSSSPASGGEHLISHYWEMLLPGCGQGTRFHGTQVGIGILIAATLYEQLAALSPADIDPETIAAQTPTWDGLETSLREQYGPAADAVVEQARKKYRSPEQARQKALGIAGQWSEIWARLSGVLKSVDEMRDLLQAVGAPTTVTGLGLKPDDLRRALAYCRHIRNRYTVFDFAADIGRWTEADQLVVLERSGTLR